jgi:hypothetical protein
MSRIKLILLGLLSALAVSAVGSASASAACTRTNPTNWVFCDHTGAELGTPPVLFLGLGGLSLLRGTITGAEAEFHCKDVHIHGKILLLGRVDLRLTYLWCKQIKPANCKLEAAQEKEIQTEELTGATVGTVPGGTPKILLQGKGAAEEFATLKTIQPTGCSIPAGGYKATGLKLIELPEPESFKVEHEFAALEEEPSKLKLGGSEAFCEGSIKIHLASKLAFAVLPGT